MGPLHGIKIVEFAALGPAPMGAMILADLRAFAPNSSAASTSPTAVPQRSTP